MASQGYNELTHWGRVTHTCVGNLTIIASDNGLSPGRRQAIIWTNAGISLIGPLGTNFSEILSEIITFSIKKMYLKVSSAKWHPFCLGLNVLTHWPLSDVVVIAQVYFLNLFTNWCFEHLLWNCSPVNATEPFWWLVNIGPGNGLVLSAII